MNAPRRGRPPKNRNTETNRVTEPVTEQDERLSRDQQTRESDVIHDEYLDEWEESANLIAPPQREGFFQRWVRIMIDGNPDNKNLMKRKRQGYKPRPADTAPNYESIKLGGSDVIGNEEMILMERPLEIERRQRARIRNDAKLQMQAVQNNMFREAKPGDGFGQVHYDNDKTSVEKGRPAPIEDDPAL